MDRLLLLLALVFVAGRFGGEIAERLRLPAVVGEISAGIVVGPAVLGLIPTAAEAPEATSALGAMSELGAIVLLFTVGLETRIGDLRRVGPTAMGVAAGGIVLPMLFGAGLMTLLGRDTGESLFVGTALVATSIGVTARVLRDRGKLATREASIILAAAVVDDVIGLLILAVVSGISRGEFSWSQTALVFVLAFAFILIFPTVGRATLRRTFPFLVRLRATDPILAVAIAMLLWLAASADLIGLAPIVGAFVAGVMLSEIGEQHDLERNMHTLAVFLVPFFFVHVGSLVDPAALGGGSNLLLVVVVIFLAILGKLIGCGLPALRLGFRSASIVGVGMVPRGEVGIIVASLGLGLGVIGPDLYGVVVLMSLFTTLVAPPLLVALFGRPAPAGR